MLHADYPITKSMKHRRIFLTIIYEYKNQQKILVLPIIQTKYEIATIWRIMTEIPNLAYSDSPKQTV